MSETRRQYNSAYYAKNRDRILAKLRARAALDREAHKARVKEVYRKWSQKHPGRVAELKRGYSNLRRYGITVEQYDEMFLAQDGKCAVCDEPPRKRQLAIDHDHATGAVRQLLCVNCNALLGHCRESQKILERAIEYLRSHAYSSQRAA